MFATLFSATDIVPYHNTPLYFNFESFGVTEAIEITIFSSIIIAVVFNTENLLFYLLPGYWKYRKNSFWDELSMLGCCAWDYT